jgi:hypothetical protein
MEVIPHQTVGKHPPAITIGHRLQDLEEPLPIPIIPKHQRPLVPTRNHVEDTTSMLDPRRTHHHTSISPKPTTFWGVDESSRKRHKSADRRRRVERRRPDPDLTVSRPDAFSLLWPKLRADYLLDALERIDQQPTSVERIEGFVDEVAEAAATCGPSAGLGEDLRLRGPGVIGSGLELDGERIQLSAFTSDGGADRAFGRIARPSRRR